MKPVFVTVLILVMVMTSGMPGWCQTPPPLVVATKGAPPFVMFSENDQSPRGITVDLINAIAAELQRPVQWRKSDLKGMLAEVASGKVDLAAAAISVTKEREYLMDFSNPYFPSGLGIAARQREQGILGIVKGLFTAGFVKAAGSLALVLLMVGLIVWLFEKKRNAEQFGGGALKGIGSGFWWSAVTMTTVGYGDKAPRTLPGRLLGTVWMFASIILISGFTAAIASSLTVARLEGTVNGPQDLPYVTVASLAHSSAAEYLTARNIRFRAEESLMDAMKDLSEGRVDAVVYDRPMLRYLVSEHFNNQLLVLDAVFAHQNYALALPQGSRLREEINRLILAYMQTSAYERSLDRWLGGK